MQFTHVSGHIVAYSKKQKKNKFGQNGFANVVLD